MNAWETQQEMGKELSHQVSTQVVKEMDYLFRIQEEKAETHYKKLDEQIRACQKNNKAFSLGRPKEKEVKAKEPHKKWFFNARPVNESK